MIPSNYELFLLGDYRVTNSLIDTDTIVYMDALKASPQFPLPLFFMKLLKFYGLLVSQLTPNGWILVCNFIKASYDLHIEPNLPIFQYLFFLSRKEEHYHFSDHSRNVMF